MIVFLRGEKKVRPSEIQLQGTGLGGGGLTLARMVAAGKPLPRLTQRGGQSPDHWHASDVSTCHMPAELGDEW